MGTVKTAISIQESLFEQVDTLAQDLHVSRSRVFVMAVEDFLQRHQNQQLLADINEAYSDEPTVEEKDNLGAMRRQHREVVANEW